MIDLNSIFKETIYVRIATNLKQTTWIICIIFMKEEIFLTSYVMYHKYFNFQMIIIKK